MDVISIAFQVSMAATVFGYGLRAEREDLLYVFRRPSLLVTSLLAMFVVMPVVALALEVYLDFPHAARVGLVVIALSPIPQLLPRNQISTGGRSSYAYGLSFTVSLLSIVIVPAMVNFVGRVMGRPFAVATDTVSVAIVTTVLAPLALGVVVKRWLPQLGERIQAPMVAVANIVLSVALVLLLVAVFPAVFEAFNLRALLAMTIFVVTGLAVGHVMAGPERDRSVVLAIACANRNPGIAIAIASQNFPTESFGPTVILYALVVGVVSIPYVNWQKRRLVTPALA